MSKSKVFLKDGFFKFLVSVEELKVKKERHIFLNSVGIDEFSANEFTEFLKRFDVEIKMDEDYIYPLAEVKKVDLQLNLSEWFALQVHHDFEVNFEHTYSFKLVKNKVEEVRKAFEKFNLERLQFKNENQIQQTHFDKLITKIDSYIVKKTTCHLVFHKKKTCEILPMRIVFLDGILCVVGENISDKTLAYFAILDLEGVDAQNENYEAHISQIEVNEFIGHLRLISGNEERLILKIFSPGEMDLLPKHHFLGNPFVTSNNEGDLIWAANIEMCDDVFEWLYAMKNHVEILDPGHMRKEFSHYCELRKEVQEKKAG